MKASLNTPFFIALLSLGLIQQCIRNYCRSPPWIAIEPPRIPKAKYATRPPVP